MDAEAAIRDILHRVVNCVRDLNFEGVRDLIPDDGIYFGSVAPVARGYEELKENQFKHVWPNVRDFTILPDSISVKSSGSQAWATCLFESGVADPSDQTKRRGRMTFVFELRNGDWIMVHSHDSLYPVTPTGSSSLSV